MKLRDFIEFTIDKLDEECFVALKNRLLGEYITFEFIEPGKIDKVIFLEKSYDYFEKVGVKTGKDFENLIQTYVSNWDSLVSHRIAKTPSTKKNEPPAATPRARKYYEKLQEIRKSRSLTNRQITDYTRIVMCLYTLIIENNFEEITDIDYSSKCLDIDRIIVAMKDEKASGLPIGKKLLFDLKDPYCEDTAIFILSMIMYYCIKNQEVEGEY